MRRRAQLSVVPLVEPCCANAIGTGGTTDQPSVPASTRASTLMSGKKMVEQRPTAAEVAEKEAQKPRLESAYFKSAAEVLDSRLRQAVFARATHRIGEIRTLRNVFEKFDADSSGTVDIGEFKHALMHLGLHCNEGEGRLENGCPTGLGGLDPRVVETLFSSYDEDGSGEISYDEFSEKFLKHADPCARRPFFSPSSLLL